MCLISINKHFSLLSFPKEIKNVGYESTFLSVCVCLSPYQLFNQLVYFYEIKLAGHVVGGDLYATILIP
jgi:hypothetical protein